MQTSTLAELVRREGIPDYQPIFFFRKEDNRGVIEFTMPALNETKPQMTPDEALQQLRALQVDLRRPTNSVKIIRSHRRERASSRGAQKRRK